jgi:homoserine/homoserine lactone efflux protein
MRVNGGFDVEWQTVWVFAGATLILLLTPGPIMAIVAGNTLTRGRAVGLRTVVGVALGEALLVGVALATLVTSSRLLPWLFPWVSLAGGAYLAWLSISALLASGRPSAGLTGKGKARPTLDGLTVALSNPAALLFYAAFFPQFIEPGKTLGLHLLILGATYLVLAVAFDTACVLLLARLRSAGAPAAPFGRVAQLSGAAVYLAISIVAITAFVDAIDAGNAGGDSGSNGAFSREIGDKSQLATGIRAVTNPR